MADTKVETTTTTTHVDHNDPLLKAKGFWDKFSKPIIYAGTAVILLVAGWYGYQNFVKAPKEKKASELIFPAENLFAKMSSTGFNKDSVNLVINGGATTDGTPINGVLKVISNYGGTAAGNRANYIAGACYLQVKDFDKAIKYLKAFDGNGANQVQSRAYVMIGHAYAEQKKTSEALEYYKKGASVASKDEAMGADALLIAAGYADATGNAKEAVDLYQKLKADYPLSGSVQNGEVDKYLAKHGVVN